MDFIVPLLRSPTTATNWGSGAQQQRPNNRVCFRNAATGRFVFVHGIPFVRFLRNVTRFKYWPSDTKNQTHEDFVQTPSAENDEDLFRYQSKSGR